MMAAKNFKKKKKKVNKTISDNGDQREILKKENKFKKGTTIFTSFPTFFIYIQDRNSTII